MFPYWILFFLLAASFPSLKAHNFPPEVSPFETLDHERRKCGQRIGASARQEGRYRNGIKAIENRWKRILKGGSVQTDKLVLNPFQRKVAQAYFHHSPDASEYKKRALSHLTNWFYQYYRQGHDLSLESFYKSAFALKALRDVDEREIERMHRFVTNYAVRMDMIN